MSEPVVIVSSFGSEICPRKSETYRYLKIEGDTLEISEAFERLSLECRKEARFKGAYRRSSLSFFGEKGIEFDFGKIESADLRKNLRDCGSAFVFAATAGSGLDRLIKRKTALSPFEGMMLSAIGSSVIEVFCDKVNNELKEAYYLKPRYSPGYGDLELAVQRDIFDFLEAEKNLGLTLTDNFFMTPVKSVTAIIGIKGDK